MLIQTITISAVSQDWAKLSVPIFQQKYTESMQCMLK